uniref:Secreted protein n=1 Tax=Arundo donax TaxID=35708 RepID=A0A0A9EJ39_ARUDO
MICLWCLSFVATRLSISCRNLWISLRRQSQWKISWIILRSKNQSLEGKNLVYGYRTCGCISTFSDRPGELKWLLLSF